MKNYKFYEKNMEKNMSKLKKKLKTQGKNSKLKVKTQRVGTFRIPGCRKSVQKKPGVHIFIFSFNTELRGLCMECTISELIYLILKKENFEALIIIKDNF